MLGANTCKNFRREWEKVVPVVLAVARKSNSAAVKKILKHYQSSIEDKCFGIQAYIPFTKNCSIIPLFFIFLYRR
jgi:hypothetical protein